MKKIIPFLLTAAVTILTATIVSFAASSYHVDKSQLQNFAGKTAVATADVTLGSAYFLTNSDGSTYTDTLKPMTTDYTIKKGDILIILESADTNTYRVTIPPTGDAELISGFLDKNYVSSDKTLISNANQCTFTNVVGTSYLTGAKKTISGRSTIYSRENGKFLIGLPGGDERFWIDASDASFNFDRTCTDVSYTAYQSIMGGGTNPTPTANSYILPNSNSKYLTEADLQGLSSAQLRLARNEIYARYGRIFDSQDLIDYFNSQAWYHGTIQPAAFNENVLNQYEKANIALIQKVEASKSGNTASTQVVLKVTMNKLQYTVNGTPMMFDVAPYLDTKANRSMIPMRFIAEAFGASVDWNDATKTQTINLNGKTFKLTQNVALPDGMGTPVLVQDRFFVPLRYVSQELGASVDWDDATQTNTIIYYK